MTYPPIPPTDAELARYLANDISAAERQRIDAWLGESASHRAHLEELETIWTAVPSAQSPSVSALWSRVRAKTVGADLSPESPLARSRPPIALPRPLRSVKTIASAAIVVFAVGGAIAIVRWPGPRTPVTTTTSVVEPAREYSTGLGEHVTIQLADGSHITLAPKTRVRILPGFGVASREVAIDGEAILDVVHDAARPFRVHIGNAIAEDIGTRFDIRSYPGDAHVTVAVAEGAVSLGQKTDTLAPSARRAPEGVVLRAGDVGRLDESGHVTTRQKALLTEYFGWTSGVLTFDSIPLDDMRQTLERWYDVRIQVDDASLKSRTITARFDGQGVHAMLSAIATTLDVDAEWHGNVVTLSKRP